MALLMAVVLAVTVPAQAQSTRRERRESNQNRRNRIRRTIEETYSHRWETGGGGGYLRFRPGGNLQQNSEISFWTTTTYLLNPRLGVVGDIRGAFGNAKLGNNGLINYDPQISEYSFMAGPSYRFVRKEKFAVTAFATGGAALGKFDGASKGFTSSDFQAVGYDLWNSGTAAAFSAGLNLDYNFFPNIAARVTPNYLGTTFGGKIENNKGLNIGLVYRFGKIK